MNSESDYVAGVFAALGLVAITAVIGQYSLSAAGLFIGGACLITAAAIYGSKRGQR